MTNQTEADYVSTFVIERLNAYDTLREENAALRREIEFAVKNGSRWTLNDWRNWRASHATAALAGKQKEG